jgi:hypothetical protein
MKIIFSVLLFLTVSTFAQTTGTIKIPSPSPKENIQTDLNFTKIGVAYSRIMRKNRVMFGDQGDALFPYGKIWRTGANDGTKVTFNDDVIIKGKTIIRGTYLILTWPGQYSWDIALYTDLTSWGVPDKYDISKEAVKLTVTPILLNNTVETFTVNAKSTTANSGVIQIGLDKVLVQIPFSVKTNNSGAGTVNISSQQSFGLSEISYNYSASPATINTEGEFVGGTIGIKQESDFGGELLKPGQYELRPDIKKNRIRIIGNGIDKYITPQKASFDDAMNNMAHGYAMNFFRLANDQKMLWLKLDILEQSYLITVKCDYDPIIMKAINDAEADGSIDKSLFTAAGYFYENDKDLNRALLWVEKDVEKNPDAFWKILLQARIQYKLGWLDKAKKTAEESVYSSVKARNPDYQELGKALVSQIEADIATKNKIDKTSPTIVITSPPNTRGLKIGEGSKQLTVIGKVTDESGIYEVTVNGATANIDEQGNFRADIPMAVGENKITVKASDIKMNKSEYDFTVTRSAATITQEDIIPVRNTIAAEGKYYALIIGVQNYLDPAIPDLDNPVQDATSLAQALLGQYTFENENVKLLKNPTRQEVFNSFEMLATKIKSEDNLVIFYAGHGNWDEVRKQGYWYPSDAYVNNRASWLSNADLKEYISIMPSKHTLLITDACFAGSIFKTRSLGPTASVAIKQLYELPSRKAMTSGALKEVPDKSVFIEYLVKRLKQNSEKYLSAEQLFSSFKLAVINNSANGQVPQYGEIKEAGDEGGDFIFIKR